MRQGMGQGIGRGRGQGMGQRKHLGKHSGRRLNRGLRQQLLRAQKNEITEYEIYSRLAGRMGRGRNRRILETIAEEERKHSRFWQGYTSKKVKAGQFNIWFILLTARLFGFTFAVKLMEKGEEKAQVNYQKIGKTIPEAKEIEKEENAHENKLVAMLDEARLKYLGSMVLGLNDALVELTGALAGLTLALQDTKLIAMTGLITGMAASLSMGASEYLSTKTESEDKDPSKKDPKKAAIYTGIMYVVTVWLLILPYFLLKNVYSALAGALIIAVLIIFGFTFYVSIAQDIKFKERFLEMAGLSLSVATISFGMGYVVQLFL